MNLQAALAATAGGLGVAFGAFGAHGLDSQLGPDAAAWWETATLYLLVHAVAALSVALAGQGGLIRLGGWAFLAGAAVFAGTLYAMALGAPRWLGAVTPIGGVLLILGWVGVAAASLRKTG